MSNISKKIPNHINRLVLLLSDDINNNNFDNKNLINEFILAIGNLSIKSIPHSHLIESLKKNYIKQEINKPYLNSSKINKRIQFNSSIDTNNLSNIINLSIFKNTLSKNDYFNKYEQKKNEFIQNKKNSFQENTNFNNNTNPQKNNFTKNNNNNQNKNNNILNNPNSALNKNFFGSSGSYMDTKPLYLKKKSNQINFEENEEEENSSSYNNYTNSIYNINKKKKKKNTNTYCEDEEDSYYNNYQNKNKRRNNKYKINNIDEDEEEFNEYDKKLRQCTGFQSAITISNAVMKNNKISENYIKNLEENNDNNNNNNNDNNTNNGNNNIISRKKFIPPLKSNSINKKSYNNINNDNPQNIEKDDKLKGMDENIISFIQNEILTKSPNVSWDDIAGLDFAKKTIKEIIIWPMLRPDLFNGIRRPPKGLLLFGPPGTGKTMIAKAIASQSKSQFFNISASSLLSKWIGESEKLVRTLFTLASINQPSVIFIDEIDSILTSRSENENESSRRIKTEFLVQLDGAGTNADDRILIIGATNRPQEIDDAFVRRLSKRLYIPLPNFISRKMLIQNVIDIETKMGNKYDISNEDIEEIVKRTKGYSGSDLINVCKEAAMMPIRNIVDICNCDKGSLRGVCFNDFLESLDNVKKSVSEKTIGQYVLWNKEFGSFQFEDKDE